MSAAAQVSASTPDPDPARAGADTPSAIVRVLNVVRRLIGYGRQLADTLQQRATAPGFALFARRFDTTDLAAILARITAGLRRAAALETRLCQRAACGRDLTVAPIRLPARRSARSVQPAALSEHEPGPDCDPRLARLPTEEEIAAEVRRRPVGAVIADICRDLGIMPGELDRPFWEELSRAIIIYGGSLNCFLPDLKKLPFGAAEAAPVGWPAVPQQSLAPATGPP